MPTKKVLIKTETGCNGDDVIAVDKPYIPQDQGMIVEFDNNLKALTAPPGQGVDARLKFYEINDDGPSASPTAYFCGQQGPIYEDNGQTLVIAKKTAVDCTVTPGGVFKYTIEADDGYDMLDPVVIVNVPTATKGFAEVLPDYLTEALLSAVLLLAVGIAIGSRFRKAGG